MAVDDWIQYLASTVTVYVAKAATNDETPTIFQSINGTHVVVHQGEIKTNQAIHGGEVVISADGIRQKCQRGEEGLIGPSLIGNFEARAIEATAGSDCVIRLIHPDAFKEASRGEARRRRLELYEWYSHLPLVTNVQTRIPIVSKRVFHSAYFYHRD